MKFKGQGVSVALAVSEDKSTISYFSPAIHSSEKKMTSK